MTPSTDHDGLGADERGRRPADVPRVGGAAADEERISSGVAAGNLRRVVAHTLFEDARVAPQASPVDRPYRKRVLVSLAE